MASQPDNFFQEETQQPQQQVPVEQSIKLGDKEYSQQDLERLVGLGQTAAELEERWNTKIDRLYPEYTQSRQKLSEYEKREQARQVQEQQLRYQQPNYQLSPEELRQQAIAEADKLGLIHQGNISQYVMNYMQANQLISDADAIASEAEAEGKPRTTAADIISYMDENGIRNPETAYKLMYERELDDWKEQQLNSVKPRAMYTETQSNAGSKMPQERSLKGVKESELIELVGESLRGR